MRKQMLAAFLGLMILSLLLSYSFIYRTVSNITIDNERQQLDQAAVFFASQNKDLPLDGLALQAENYAQNLDIRLSLVSTAPESFGQVLLDTAADPTLMENHGDREEIAGAFAKGEGFAIRESSTTHKSYLYRSYDGQIFGGQEVMLRLAKPISGLKAIQQRLNVAYLLLSLGLLVSSIALFGLMTTSVLRPLHDLSGRIEHMENKSTVSLLPTYKDPQVDQLADSFNKLMVLLNENVDMLRQNNQELKNIFQNVSSGLVMLDGQGLVRVANQPAMELLDILDEDLKGRPIFGLMDQPELQEHIRQVSQTREKQEFEIEWANGRLYELQLSPLLEELKPDELKGILMVLEDVTELRSVENMRRDFVANVSHELKTPLTTIRGFVETLLNDDLQNPAIIRKFLGIIEMEADRLQTMIFQLLYLSKLDSKVQAVDIVQLSLEDYLDRFVYTMKDRADAKNIQLFYQIEPKDLNYYGSENLLHQILLNLVENAIDYSQGSRIDIRFTRTPSGLLLEVADDGIGIAKKEQSRIYERFYRVEKSRAQSRGGTGLGLAIVKHLVANVGGKITLHSELGKGSHFRVLLPFTQGSEQ